MNVEIEVEVEISATLTWRYPAGSRQPSFVFAMTIISAGASFLLVLDKASLLKNVPFDSTYESK